VQTITPLDTLDIENGYLKGMETIVSIIIIIPQNDLSIEVEGFNIIPVKALGTWIDFAL
jgi:hypothetical protein